MPCLPRCSVSVPRLGQRQPEVAAISLRAFDVNRPSLRFDRATKGPLYAEMGVPEYWIVDLAGKVIEIHQSPRDGRFERTFVAKPGESIRPVAFADVSIAVSSIVR